jgi:hypothetical protein
MIGVLSILPQRLHTPYIHTVHTTAILRTAMLQIAHYPSSPLAADAPLRRSSPDATPSTASLASGAQAHTAFACVSGQSGMRQSPGIAGETTARSMSAALIEMLGASGLGWLFAGSGR